MRTKKPKQRLPLKTLRAVGLDRARDVVTWRDVRNTGIRLTLKKATDENDRLGGDGARVAELCRQAAALATGRGPVTIAA